MESKTTELEAQAKIVLAEAQGSWLQRNWRTIDGHLCLPLRSPLVRAYRLKHPRKRSKFASQHRHGRRWWICRWA